MSSVLKLMVLSTLFALGRCEILQKVKDPTRVFKTFFGHCSHKEDVIKCLKIQALKVTERANQIKFINVVDGLQIVSNDRMAKSVSGFSFNESKLEKLRGEELDSLLALRANW